MLEGESLRAVLLHDLGARDGGVEGTGDLQR
jgi:hypothetical protein